MSREETALQCPPLKNGPRQTFPTGHCEVMELSKLPIAGHAVLDRWGFQDHNWWPALWCDWKSPVPTHAWLYSQPEWRVPESLLL